MIDPSKRSVIEADLKLTGFQKLDYSAIANKHQVSRRFIEQIVHENKLSSAGTAASIDALVTHTTPEKLASVCTNASDVPIANHPNPAVGLCKVSTKVLKENNFDWSQEEKSKKCIGARHSAKGSNYHGATLFPRRPGFNFTAHRKLVGILLKNKDCFTPIFKIAQKHAPKELVKFVAIPLKRKTGKKNTAKDF